MGWRSGMRSKKAILKTLGMPEGDDPDQTALISQKQIEALIEAAYEKGYEDGFEASSTYDPRWDAD